MEKKMTKKVMYGTKRKKLYVKYKCFIFSFSRNLILRKTLTRLNNNNNNNNMLGLRVLAQRCAQMGMASRGFSSVCLGARGLGVRGLGARTQQQSLLGRSVHSLLRREIPLVVVPFQRSFHLGTEETPNPDSLKFFPGTQLMPDGRTHNFSSRETSLCSPLAMRLFEVEGVKSAFFGLDFITINKDERMEWIEIQPDIYSAFSDFFSSGEALFSRDPEEVAPPRADVDYEGEEEEVVEMIKELIDVKVRPMVQEDGGDVEFLKFEEGVVFLRMQGACSGCPSAPATLKGGIERMLMHWVPEVQGVVGVEGDEELASINHTQFTEFENSLNSQESAQQEEVNEIVSDLKQDSYLGKE